VLNQDHDVFAYVLDDKGKNVGTVSYVENSDGDNACWDEIELEDGYKFALAPRPVKEKERTTLFIASESGAGKSYFIREYAKRYRKMFPHNQIYIISYLDRDETIDEFKDIIRLNASNEEFLSECLDFDLEVEVKDSLVIFDDIDSIVNKKTKQAIYGLLNKC